MITQIGEAFLGEVGGCFLLDFFDCFDPFGFLDDLDAVGVGAVEGAFDRPVVFGPFFDVCFELFFEGPVITVVVGPSGDCRPTAGA